ncbi:MAG: Crp/Fnr family transcriptional regulator [Chitinispirillaceae bacterium]
MSGGQVSAKSGSAVSRVLRQKPKIFKRGSLMFIEGETSTSMFIIRTGKVRIFKQQGEQCVELAVLGPGSVLGELSLLDHQPRSATAQVIEDTTVTVIDEELLSQTLKRIPPWLASVIQVVVKRLRDTMKRTTEDMVNKSIGGVLKILLTLAATEGVEKDAHVTVSLFRAKQLIGEIIGIGEVVAENVFLHLILKEMIYIRKDSRGEEYVLLNDAFVMQQYMNYLRAKQCGITLPGENLDENAFELIKYIITIGDKEGKRVKEHVYKVGLQQILLARSRDGKSHHIDTDALHQLLKDKIVLCKTEKTATSPGIHNNDVIMYNRRTVQKVICMHEWLPVFKEEIRF